MDLGLKGKVVVVGGASKGIGKATALVFAREGAKVAISARDPDLLQGAAEEIHKETGAEVLPIPGDLSQLEATDRFIDETVEHFGTVHVVVANTGGPRSVGSATCRMRTGRMRLLSIFLVLYASFAKRCHTCRSRTGAVSSV